MAKLKHGIRPVVHLLAWDRVKQTVAVILKDPEARPGEGHYLAHLMVNDLVCEPPCKDIEGPGSPLFNAPVIVYPDGDVIPRGTRD